MVEVDCVVEYTERPSFSSMAVRSIGPDVGELVRELWTSAGMKPFSQTIIFLQSTERLVTSGRPFSPTSLRALVSLPRLTKRRLSLVLLSRLSWPRFRVFAGLDCSEPACVHFSSYTTDEISTALRHMYITPDDAALNEVSRNTGDSLYPGFVRLVSVLLSSITIDLRELHNISTEMCPRYLVHLNTIGTIKINAATLLLTLNNTVTPELRRLLQNMHRRE